MKKPTAKHVFSLSKRIVFIFSSFALFACNADTDNQASTTQSGDAKIAIAIHGGAGTILKKNMSDEREAAYREILERAVRAGYAELQAGKDGTEAVITAIEIMENSPLFNAGVGAVYTFDETHELDASIMHGLERQAGAVAGVKTIRNPIKAAMLVMQESPHVMLTGEGAEAFAAQNSLEMVENSHFNSKRRFDSLQKAKKRIASQQDKAQKSASIYDAIAASEFQDYKFGTVGAVVLDKQGNLVAGTSTGGMTAKRYGRVGDSPIIGAGTFADNNSCAVSATGHGEYFIRYNVAADICARMLYQNVSLEQASNTVLFDVLNSERGEGGVIAVDKQGNIAMPFNSAGMYRASIDVNGKLTVEIYK